MQTIVVLDKAVELLESERVIQQKLEYIEKDIVKYMKDEELVTLDYKGCRFELKTIERKTWITAVLINSLKHRFSEFVKRPTGQELTQELNESEIVNAEIMYKEFPGVKSEALKVVFVDVLEITILPNKSEG